MRSVRAKLLARLRLWCVLFFLEALRGLARHRMRSALSALGVLIGIAAVVLVVAVGRKGSQAAEAELAKLGDNLIWVEAGSRNVNGVRSGTHGMTNLTIDDMQAIVREVKLVKAAAPNVDFNAQLVYGAKNWGTHLRGVSPAYERIKSWTIDEGRYFDDEDVAENKSVCVLGATVRRELFGAESPIGATVRIGEHLFEVVGVLAPKGQSQNGRDQDDEVHLPYTTLEARLRGSGILWVDDILVSARSREDIPKAIRRISAVMREQHRIGEGADDDFNIRHPDAVINAQIEASHTLALFLTTIASISLLVGGIGIMNVMLASVSQRTREIGLRLAIGAPRSAIVAQFVGEAVLLSVLGGVCGVASSFAGAVLLGHALGWTLVIAPDAMLLALVFSALVGVFFGAYPAARAARMDPIHALRAE